jgi:uncharacterized protein YdiU (UPF0061 family)
MNQLVDETLLAAGNAPFAVPRLPALGNQFASLDAAFFSATSASTLPEPYPIAVSATLAAELGLAAEDLSGPAWTEVFAGNLLLPGSKPLAAVYSGHQFGVWAGQLGDGRALLLGDLIGASGQRFELQLKGA